MTREMLRILGKLVIVVMHKNAALFEKFIQDEMNLLVSLAEREAGALAGVKSGGISLIGKLVLLALHEDNGAIDAAATQALDELLGQAEAKIAPLAN